MVTTSLNLTKRLAISPLTVSPLIQYAVLYSTLAQKISECISMTLEILKNLKKSKQYTLYQGNGLLLVCIVAPAN